MSKFNDLLNLRFKTKEAPQQKMTALVERATNGDLSSFSGIFRVTALNDSEKSTLEEILKSFRHAETDDVDLDLKALVAITSEVKAITNQAVILHGERIKKAQDILKKYRDGAFTAWLYATYGNRQTPYNFLQYYEFYILMPQALHPKIDQMPRQAVYTLASRNGSIEKKQEIVTSYAGQPKQELLKIIRQLFPLAEDDGRMPNFGAHGVAFLKRAREMFKHSHCRLTQSEKEKARLLCEQIRTLIEHT
ncbi:MAG: hypothetical protein HW387_620 [Parachlamydiales bacterium]|nr:hypothetical protein [Parachlamydiales bacterium]